MKKNFDEFFNKPQEVIKETKTAENNNDVIGNTQLNDFEKFNSITPDEPQPENTQYRQQQQTSLNAGNLFSPELVTEVGDKVFSGLFAFLLTMVTKKQISAGRLAATQAEKKMIEPVLKSYMDSINFQMTPLNALLATIAAVYGMKGIEIANGMNRQQKAPEATTGPQVYNEPKQQSTGGRPPKDYNSRYMRKKRGEL